MGFFSDLFGSNKPDQSSSWANDLYVLGQGQAQYGTDKNNTSTLFNGSSTGFKQASQTLGQVANYDQGILSGNRSQEAALLAPENSKLISQYDTARKSMNELSPRGGGRATQMNELPFKEAGDLNKISQAARPAAAEGLAKVGSAEGILASEQGNLAATFNQQAQSDVFSSLQYLLGKKQFDFTKSQQQGQSAAGFGQIFGQLAGTLASNPELLAGLGL